MIDQIRKTSKITCTKCKKAKGVRPDVLNARVLKYGSFEELIKNYVCAHCRKEHNVNAVGEKVLVNHKNEVVDAFWRKPDYTFPVKGVNRHATHEDIEHMTLTSCLMPNLCLDGTCIKCRYYEYCRLTDAGGNFRKVTDQIKLDAKGQPIKAEKVKVTVLDPRTLSQIADMKIVENKQVTEKPAKGKRGRPKGSKNKKQKNVDSGLTTDKKSV